jgi:deazaflavin-dependent oxidoreductase (nitroreductase family)
VKTRPALADVGFKALNWVHRAALRVSGGRVGWTALGMPVIELRTVGRASGRARTTMLTVPVVDGDRLILVASKGGDDRDPDWFLNLVARPDVELTMAGVRRTMRARVATSREATALWPRIVTAYRPYDGYRRRANREIPLVICEPR